MLQVLDTFIGLITVYLILSLIVSAIGNGLTSHFNLKGGIVLRMLLSLLGKRGAAAFTAHPEFIALCTEQAISARLYHRLQRLWTFRWLMALRGDVEYNGKHYRAPAYLPHDVFVSIVVDLLKTRGGPAAATAVAVDRALQNTANPAEDLTWIRALRGLWQDVSCDLDAFKLAVHNWFERTCTRSYEWYQRQIGLYLFIAGFGTALLLNADTLHMFEVLSDDPALRDQFVQLASTFDGDLQNNLENENVPVGGTPLGNAICANANIDAGQCTDEAITRLLLPELLPLIGWDAAAPEIKNLCFKPWSDSCAFLAVWTNTLAVHQLLLKLLGLLLTAAAISLGAPFWFDLLRKVIQVRGVIRTSDDKSATPPTSTNPSQAAVQAAPAAKSLVRAVTVAPEARTSIAGFHSNAFGYDALNYYWSARLANLAYDTQEIIAATVADWGAEAALVTHRDPPKCIDTQCLVARTTSAAFLSLRGTEKRLDDWLTDAFVKQKAPDAELGVPDTLVHCGFHDALFALDASGVSAWTRIIAHPLLKEALDKGLPIWVSGHSLGGALAILLALRLRTEIAQRNSQSTVASIQTFGQPRVGNKAFAASVDAIFTGRYFRSINHRDIVPRVPFPQTPAVWLDAGSVDRGVFEYVHCGRVLYFNELGQALIDPPLWYRTIDQLALTMSKEELKEALKENAADHGIALYCGLQEKLLAQPVSATTTTTLVPATA